MRSKQKEGEEGEEWCYQEGSGYDKMSNTVERVESIEEELILSCYQIAVIGYIES